MTLGFEENKISIFKNKERKVNRKHAVDALQEGKFFFLSESNNIGSKISIILTRGPKYC